MTKVLMAMFEEFDWLPAELTSMWVMGVKSKHEIHGWHHLSGIIWDEDTMVFLAEYEGARNVLKVASNVWTNIFRPRKAKEYRTYIVSIILAIESLGCDFAGWGSHFPEAKSKADKILDTYFRKTQTRLLDVYMPLRGQMDQDEIRKDLGPKKP